MHIPTGKEEEADEIAALLHSRRRDARHDGERGAGGGREGTDRHEESGGRRLPKEPGVVVGLQASDSETVVVRYHIGRGERDGRDGSESDDVGRVAGWDEVEGDAGGSTASGGLREASIWEGHGKTSVREESGAYVDSLERRLLTMERSMMAMQRAYEEQAQLLRLLVHPSGSRLACLHGQDRSSSVAPIQHKAAAAPDDEDAVARVVQVVGYMCA